MPYFKMLNHLPYFVKNKGVLYLKLGARILKTGIAIILAVSIASLLPSSAGMITVAGISAVVAMQPSVYRSFKTIIDQFKVMS